MILDTHPNSLNYYSDNHITSLINGPKSIQGDYDCSNNELIDLIGAPNNVIDFDVSGNLLTSLKGIPLDIKVFASHDNHYLIDLSDIWKSEIESVTIEVINPEMAILPLVKFNVHFYAEIKLTNIFEKHRGDSKQNIIDLQYDLIENGYEEKAKWQPK